VKCLHCPRNSNREDILSDKPSQPLVSKLYWEGEMKMLLSLDTGLVKQFTDCGGQYGKAGFIACYYFRLSFVPFLNDRRKFL
jgi:hypothetical protein